MLTVTARMIDIIPGEPTISVLNTLDIDENHVGDGDTPINLAGTVHHHTTLIHTKGVEIPIFVQWLCKEP